MIRKPSGRSIVDMGHSIQEGKGQRLPAMFLSS
jgi:hypothetical protein